MDRNNSGRFCVLDNFAFVWRVGYRHHDFMLDKQVQNVLFNNVPIEPSLNRRC